MLEIERLHARFLDYSHTFKGNTESTVRWLRIDFGQFMRVTAVDELVEVDETVIEDFLMWGKREKNWKNKTVKTKLQGLRLFFKWCVEKKHMEKNPTDGIDSPKAEKPLPTHLSVEEARELLEWTRNYRYHYRLERRRAVAIMAMFIYTGIRRNELISLKFEDVDFSQKMLRVKNGKGRKDRVVPLHRNLIGILRSYIKERDRLGRMTPSFFVSLRRDIPMGAKALARLFEKIKKVSGMHVYPHKLRHTFATQLLQGGCDLHSLSKMMGHERIETTAIYLSTVPEHLKQQVNKHPLDY